MFSSRIAFVLLLCGLVSLGESTPFTGVRPPYREYAKMARYLVHKSNWTSMGTISSASSIQGYPMVNVKSIADSAWNGPSTGHIYFLLTDLDFTGKDVTVTNKVTVLFSEDQDLACTSKNKDTQEPTCARAIFTGSVERLTKGTDEYKRASEYYTNRHPASLNWPIGHGWHYHKLNIEQIIIIDFYGGAKYVSADDYYKANYDQ